mgnify:CR=1 FL=1
MMRMSARMRERITIRLTARYMEFLDRLVEEGVYNSRNEAIRDGLRLLFERHGFKLLEGEPHPPPARPRSRSA